MLLTDNSLWMNGRGYLEEGAKTCECFVTSRKEPVGERDDCPG